MTEEGQLLTSDLPKRVLIVAPVGAYLGRVKSGVKWALGRIDVDSKRLENRIVFVVSRRWTREPGYNRDVVNLTKDFDSQPLREQFKELTVATEEVDIDSEDSCEEWLVKTLGAFFQKKDGAAFIDLTSAPKEWLFACVFIAQLFDRITFYYVKPRVEKELEQFPEPVRKDEGLIAESVTISVGSYFDKVLHRWLTEGTSSWKLFRCMYRKAIELSKTQQKPIPSIWIPVNSLAELANEWFVKDDRQQVRIRDSLKSISKHLTEIAGAGLFARKGNHVCFTGRGYALARSTFPELDTGPASVGSDDAAVG